MDEELSKEVKALGFPIEHKHKLCCLRQELIDSFVDSRYMMFIKYAAFHLQQLNLRKNEEALNKTVKQENEKNAIKSKEDEEESKEDDEKEKDEKQIETEEAKKMVESITDGNKLECKKEFVEIVCDLLLFLFQWKKAQRI